MKAIQKVVSQITAKEATLERLRAELESTRAAANGADQFAPKLEELRLERRDILARALIAKKAPNTATLDAQLQSVEAQHALAQESAQAARDAIDIIANAIEIEETDLEKLRGDLKSAITTELVDRHNAAQERYAKIVDELEESAAEMAACGRAFDHIRYLLRDETGLMPSFPAHGLKVLDELRNKGLRVPHGHSMLADPRVAEEYMPSYVDHWFAPKWLDERNLGFADKHVAKIVDEINKAGVHTYGFTPYQAPEEEPQVRVRLVKFTIQGAPRITRDPETGKVAWSEPVVFGDGDDCWISESLARKLRSQFKVLIHGEDRMPVLQPANAPAVVEAIHPDKPRRMTPGSSDPRAGYSGTFHSMDLSAYGD
ncbi:hypothetical protein AWB71_00678 [Caballeronia peredens]|nr:hypothetical protein AWB71_00678 [Caballeronia peredens]